MTRPPGPLGVRSDLVAVEPYVSPQAAARIRLNTNESPYSPPAAVVDAAIGELRDCALNRYPERDAGALVAAIAEHNHWPDEGVWVANGSNEVFLHLFLAYGGPGRTSLTFEPTYSLHTLIPKITGTHTVGVARDEDLTIELERAVAAVEENAPDIVIVCSPNNPSGGCEPGSTVRALARCAPGLVVVDEAYVEFAGDHASARPLLEEHSNLVVTRTFSKAWRLAGVRLGYMLGAPALVEGLARVRLPYHLSSVTQAVGRAALEHAGDAIASAAMVAAERERIERGLRALGVVTFPSQANFVLFRVAAAERVWRALMDRDILIRNYSDQPGLSGCLRVTAGLPEETDAFLAALREVIDG